MDSAALGFYFSSSSLSASRAATSLLDTFADEFVGSKPIGATCLDLLGEAPG